MQQTLFFIPHEWFDGRLLIGWLVIGALVFIWLLIRNGMSQDTWTFLPFYGLVAGILWLVVPQLEVYGVNPQDPTGDQIKVGLALRGYGVMLLLAIVSGVGLILSRCKQAGYNPDQILSLAFWMTLAGIAGARILYVVQKHEDFFGGNASLKDTIVSVVDMTKGGLVVYGSLIGGMLAAIIFFRITKLSFLRTADLIAPGMMLGLAIGRIGCLMNGCCYGGICDNEMPGLRFPTGSPPYMQQLYFGDLLGMTTVQKSDDSIYERRVVSVQPGGIADSLKIPVDDMVTINPGDPSLLKYYKENVTTWDDERELVIYLDSEKLGRSFTVPVNELADRSVKVHPTQIYSSINAVLLCLALWFMWTIRKFDGEVFALMLIFYSIARFMLEIVRRDEAGLMGTSLTISQWVSIGTIVVGLALMAYVRAWGKPAVNRLESPSVGTSIV